MRHIGIVGCSAPGAALCFQTICTEAPAIVGRKYAHPEVSMRTAPFDEYMRHVEAGAWERVAELMLCSSEKLAAIGASFLVTPDNTIHQALDLFRSRSPLPWLHIAENTSTGGAQRLASGSGPGRAGAGAAFPKCHAELAGPLGGLARLAR